MKTPEQFFCEQLALWPMARKNYEALEQAESRPTGFGEVRAQFNPARAVSTGAKTDAETIKKRPCFLCAGNRPAEQIADSRFPGYDLLVNPFPIFRRHFTIASKSHEPQRIAGYGGDMFAMAEELPGFAVFYNGPRCGASAPDHRHFQAVPDTLPIMSKPAYDWFTTLRFTAASAEEARQKLDEALTQTAKLPGQPSPESGEEPMVNVLAGKGAGAAVEFTVIPRKAHRPSCYGTGQGQMLVSPASVDLGGLLITPRRCDFEALNPQIVRRIFSEVCYPAEPLVTVGIIENAAEIPFELHGPFRRKEDTAGNLTFIPERPDCRFTLRDVEIGKGFHWQRTEPQTFAGELTLLKSPEGITAINTVPVEEYLKSVISSEMSATSSETLLEAHAIVSRSWLLAMLGRTGGEALHHAEFESPEGYPETVLWFDREEHTRFDVCADDHCQRYQGITRQTSEAVARAVDKTRGMVITYGGKICDARFSKCCGGITEEFSACWDSNENHPYLTSHPDNLGGDDFCSTADPAILRQVLNSYDREQPDFYRWEVILKAATLPELLKEKTGVDFGKILSLKPLTRGKSGRITRLLIEGEKCSRVIGKELAIRKALSPSCLKSSAFEVEALPGGDFRLKGRGWGHGVGMCQIGAAVMSETGYTPKQIIAHYFPGTEITRLYD